jgi:hypothetical protein
VNGTPEPTCSKCGGKPTKPRFCQGKIGCKVEPRSSSEHLERRCMTCGYTWAEPTLEQRQQQEAAS